jgi:hypothetical protein
MLTAFSRFTLARFERDQSGQTWALDIRDIQLFDNMG